MQTLVLGSAASQESVEAFFEHLGDEAIEVVGPNGQVRARVIPTSLPESVNRTDAIDRRIVAEFTKDLEELTRIARLPNTGRTTEDLLRELNSLPLPS